ncbi:sigma-70 family RNA polymerase sigma factor [Brevibacterium renqingii]|uniref:sigma-70 family RNA polymerase sigma factor n=1 Tax=Brevibacterium renqingii TaxID=2776916 RepID=UPI001ADFA5C7|nr:sigma-70 family RNA polymerase sigma factor [Brevibacterium renqingii]
MTEAWSSSADDSHSPFGLPRTSSELSDSELCARIRRHRPDSSAGRSAFGELYARHRLPALHLALRLNRDRSRAEDAVAEAFAKIWRAWGQNAGPEESFKPYLMAAVRSESYRRTATNRATTVVEPEVLTFLADSEPSDHAAEVAERDQLGRAFRGLPDTWQSALTLIDIDGRPTADAAESMDLSPNSFSSLLRRAREGLRAAYLQEHVEPSPPECAEYSAELARFVRQQLSPKRAEAIEAHLSHCSHCRRQSFRLRSLNTTFQAWITPAALAAALIEIGHFPEGALLLSEGSTISVASAAHSGSAVPEPHSSTLVGSSKSSAGTAAAGSSGGSTAGIAAGASAVKVAVVSIAATAAIAAGAVTLVNLQNDSAPQTAAAAETSSAPAASTPPTPRPTSSPEATAPEDGSGKSAGAEEGPEKADPERSNPRDEARTPDQREEPSRETEESSPNQREDPSPEAEESSPETEDAHAPVSEADSQPAAPGDRDETPKEGDENQPAEAPPEEPDEPSPARTTEAAEPTPAEEPTAESDPEPEPTDSDEHSPEPSSTPSPGPGPDSDAEVEGAGTSEAEGIDASDADGVNASDADGEDGADGFHCHDFGWWEYCH